MDLLDLSVLDRVDPSILKPELKGIVGRILTKTPTFCLSMLLKGRGFLARSRMKSWASGPLEPFMQDPTVSDILVNTYKQIYVERFGKLEPTDARFKDDAHLRKIIDKIVSAVGRRIDESSPMVDARLPDGSRVNAIIPPLAIDGPILSIRRFAVDPLELEDLINLKTLDSARSGSF